MKCPVCNVELKMADRQGVEIDYCPQCRGVWLDRGELDKIIDRSSSAVYDDDRRDDDERDDHYRHGEQHHGPQHRKRKSFLGDIFDFD
ncbi:MAG: zf-TFIIB domain-containing protein [bacterium]